MRFITRIVLCVCVLTCAAGTNSVRAAILTPGDVLRVRFTAAPAAPVPDVRTGRRDAPPPLAALVTRLLQKEPGARPQGAGEVVQALSGMLAFET